MSWLDAVRNKYQLEEYYDPVYDNEGHISHYECDFTKYRAYDIEIKTMHMLKNPHYPGFRNGPIPGIKHYSHGWWHKYRGKHSHSFLSEFKSDCAFAADCFELREFMNPDSVIRSKRFALVRYWTMEYDEIHGNFGKGHGWKRSRKKRQWN